VLLACIAPLPTAAKHGKHPGAAIGGVSWLQEPAVDSRQEESAGFTYAVRTVTTLSHLQFPSPSQVSAASLALLPSPTTTPRREQLWCLDPCFVPCMGRDLTCCMGRDLRCCARIWPPAPLQMKPCWLAFTLTLPGGCFACCLYKVPTVVVSRAAQQEKVSVGQGRELLLGCTSCTAANRWRRRAVRLD
jgi:hypothetical protein